MTQRQMAHLPRLLWMYYSPSDLADEIGCNVDTVYKSYIPAGCPHKRDERGRWRRSSASRVRREGESSESEE
jgi:hypothetical protein